MWNYGHCVYKVYINGCVRIFPSQQNSTRTFKKKWVNLDNNSIYIYIYIPKVYVVAGRSWFGLLNTILCSSTQSHAMRSYIACSFRLSGLILTVTNIFSSRNFEPPGVDESVLRILVSGVTADVRIIFAFYYSPLCKKKKKINKLNKQLMISKWITKWTHSLSEPSHYHNHHFK